MAARTTIAIVGSGRLGKALALELKRAGYRISEIISRDTPHSRRQAGSLAGKVAASPATCHTARLDANLVWFCVSDREIASAARGLARRSPWEGKMAFHSSGALPSDELGALRRRGAAVASVHPLMTFVNRSAPSLRGVPFGVEGDKAAVRTARRIVRDLGGESFALAKQAKAAYHTWGAFTSPLLVALLVNAEQVARIAGLSARNARKKMLPILRQTIANYEALGAAGAFSGPLIRGDAGIVRKHIKVLKEIPEARAVYLALATSALRHLPVRNQRELARALKT